MKIDTEKDYFYHMLLFGCIGLIAGILATRAYFLEEKATSLGLTMLQVTEHGWITKEEMDRKPKR